MKRISKLLASFAMFAITANAYAQPPGGERGPDGPRGFQGGRDSEKERDFEKERGGKSPVDRLMAMDANGDDQLTADEVTDPRLQPMIDRADGDDDGIVTKAELAMMVDQRSARDEDRPRGGDRGPRDGGDWGPGGPDGPGGPGRGPGGPGGPDHGPEHGRGPSGPPPHAMHGGPGGFGRPIVGQVLPPFVQDDLELTADQREAITKLQAEVDAQLAKILTTEQQEKLKQGPPHMRDPSDRRGGPDGLDRGDRGRGPGRPPRD